MAQPRRVNDGRLVPPEEPSPFLGRRRRRQAVANGVGGLDPQGPVDTDVGIPDADTRVVVMEQLTRLVRDLNRNLAERDQRLMDMANRIEQRLHIMEQAIFALNQTPQVYTGTSAMADDLGIKVMREPEREPWRRWYEQRVMGNFIPPEPRT